MPAVNMRAALRATSISPVSPVPFIALATAAFVFATSLPSQVSAQFRQQPARPSTQAAPASQTTPATPATTAAPATPAADGQATRSSRPLDRIVAVVNDEVITANELRARTQMAESQLKRQKITPPSTSVLQQQVLDRMIVDRAALQLARETGVRVDDATINATIGRIAESNGMTVQAMRQRLESDGMSFAQFREDIRQDIILNRLREREVDARVAVTDSELDNFIAEQAGVAADAEEINLAQILLRVPENADPERVETTRKRAEELREQARSGTDFARLAASYSNAPEALQGGELGWRHGDRLPTLFVDAIKGLKTGEISPIVRSPNGFHILKLLGRRSAVEGQLAGAPVQQTHARHILLRVSELTPEPEVRRRLEEFKSRIEAGQIEFATLARLHSVDPSGSRGGDLGWLYPGDTVPEFEKAMASLKPNEVSAPVRTPFGWHLIQVLERRTETAGVDRTRMRARAALHERKAGEAYEEWLRQLRDRTYVEYRLDERS